MWIFNSIFGKIFEFIFFPFSNLSPWVGMILISFLTGILMLLVFRFTSNQTGIRKTKNKIKAHLLELRLFKNSLALSFKAQGNILRYNLKYLGYTIKPFLVMIVPVILILIQLNVWFGYRSLKPGEATVLKVMLNDDQNPLDINLSVFPGKALAIETPPLRIQEEKEISWRLRAKEKGIHLISFGINGLAFSKEVAVDQKKLTKISPFKVQRNFIDELLNPGEAPLPRKLPVKSIEIMYPANKMNFFGWHLEWWIVYFALAIIFGFSLKGVFKVEV